MGVSARYSFDFCPCPGGHVAILLEATGKEEAGSTWVSALATPEGRMLTCSGLLASFGLSPQPFTRHALQLI